MLMPTQTAKHATQSMQIALPLCFIPTRDKTFECSPEKIQTAAYFVSASIYYSVIPPTKDKTFKIFNNIERFPCVAPSQQLPAVINLMFYAVNIRFCLILNFR